MIAEKMTQVDNVKARILIIEDDKILNKQLRVLLDGAGFEVTQSYDGDAGLLTAVSDQFDLILLDVALPGIDGYNVLKVLRQSRETPVIMLTAHGAEEERIIGLRNGADDYLSKPFNLTELLLRIEAILRRSLRQTKPEVSVSHMNRSGLQLDKTTQEVYFDGKKITFTPLQFKLLWILMQHPSQTLSKPQLYRLVLERDFSRYDRSLDMHMSRVRRKLVAAGMPADRLQTVHGTGYILL
ncbi:Copper-sensing two-component system response regulator CpxR [Methylophaga thiooxydans]|nr:Copper-sensing two-component system response regulator CpxR [Methylophaga thiooxydans]